MAKDEKKVVREKAPNADFGVYFNFTNKSKWNMEFISFVSNNGGCTTCDWKESQVIPNDGKPYQVHLNDPCSSQGADGIIRFQGDKPEYKWSGACPVWSPENSASGPGIQDWNRGGHPLTVTILVDDSTLASATKEHAGKKK